jgi:peptidoglycan/xylan/chitin deacetylase (PgdA/CDA1 family)
MLSVDELKINLNSSLQEIGEAALPSSFKDEQEKIKILRANRSIFQFAGKKLKKLNNELIQKIEIESEELQLKDLNQDEPKKADLKFYPSTGPNGNVVGLIFPKNVWALTYDDGPHPFHTPKIVNNLKELDIKATFFWLAENIIPHQSIVNLVREEGNATENHSWSHVQLTKASESVLHKEIIESTLLDTKAYGERPKFFRCPYGAGNSVTRIRKIIADQDLIHVYWNADSLDWQDKDPASIVARTQKQMKLAEHGVILFHDIHPQSVIASKELIEWSKSLSGTENEIRWVTIPEIVNELNQEKQAPK